MLKRKKDQEKEQEPEPEMPNLKHVEEPVVELKKVEKVGTDDGGWEFPLCIEIKPRKL